MVQISLLIVEFKLYNIHICILYFHATTAFLRLERLDIRTSTGKAMVLGTLMGIGGVMILTFYKSTEIHIWSTHVSMMRHPQPHNVSSNQILGSALGFGTCLCYSMWLIIQVFFTHALTLIKLV